MATLTPKNEFDNGKIAVALRTARTAMGWSQLEFAELMEVAKSTVARIETMEMLAKADFVMKAIRLFKVHGVEVDLYTDDFIRINITKQSVNESILVLKDINKRRRDRK
jgi:transcriptional regulator with XRE-family HTH domain